MYREHKIFVIIPAFNEEEAIAQVIEEIPEFVDKIIVVNNGSTDQTAQTAESAGAVALTENERGYGAACLKGIGYSVSYSPDIIVFLDGDHSDYPSEMDKLIEPIAGDNIDLVIGSRLLGKRERGAMLPQAIFGNWLATRLIKVFWKYRCTDLGPFRAIKFSSLINLNMCDRNFGWTVEMQIKVAKQKLSVTEVPVSYRKRVGKSKVTGTVKGTIKASIKILYLIFKSIFII